MRLCLRRAVHHGARSALLGAALVAGCFGREDVELVPSALDQGADAGATKDARHATDPGDAAEADADACVTGCFPLGAACSHAADCCSMGCSSGFCLTNRCAENGDSCNHDSDCCSDDCESGQCANDDPSNCQSKGDTCNGPGDCCSGVCLGGSCGAPCGNQ